MSNHIKIHILYLIKQLFVTYVRWFLNNILQESEHNRFGIYVCKYKYFTRIYYQKHYNRFNWIIHCISQDSIDFVPRILIEEKIYAFYFLLYWIWMTKKYEIWTSKTHSVLLLPIHAPIFDGECNPNRYALLYLSDREYNIFLSEIIGCGRN